VPENGATPIKAKWIDINTILGLLNVVVAGLIACGFYRVENNIYVDQETIVLGIALCAQTQFVLWLESRRRDPFVIMIVYLMILYYSLRIFTLTLYPYSEVFTRYPYDYRDSNSALIFILIANVFLYAGLYVVRIERNELPAASEKWRATSPGSVVFLLIAAIIFAYFSGRYWTADNIPRGANFLALLLTPQIVSLMTLTYYVLYRKSLSRSFALAIAILIVIDMVVHTLIGSRSAIVGFIEAVMLVMLAIYGRIRMRRRYVWWCLGLSPLGVVLLVAAFVISTYNRVTKEVGTPFDLSRAVQAASEAASQLQSGQSLDVVLPPILSRAGFFDYDAEIIAHRGKYRSLINLGAYGKSVVDNLLTPGFDVYDQPKIAQALQFVYNDMGPPSKEEMADSYQSDQLGVYGEFYGLFGYACLPLLFIAAFVLKRLYRGARSSNPFHLALKRIIVLYVFLEFIRSFGLDWTLVDTVSLIAATYLYTLFFLSERAPVTAANTAGRPQAA